jgi:hypothetical protein
MKVKTFIVCSLLVLFFGFTFNAYACLLPLPPTMESGCATPEEEPLRQFCDTFTVLGPQSLADLPHSPTLQGVDVASWVAGDSPLRSVRVGAPNSPEQIKDSTPADILLKTNVLRI